ncbi:MAG: transporter substrate-binding domain-containing protein [Pseudomonadota bacterium]
MVVNRWHVALGLGLLVGWAAPASAQAPSSRLDQVMTQKQLRIGTTGDYKPFSDLNPETKAFEGIDIDMARALAAALGVEPRFVETAWSTLMADLAADKFDIAMGGISVTLERQKTAWFSSPYLAGGKTPIARCADQARYQTLADIDRAGVRLIVNPGGTNERFARAAITHATIALFDDNRAIFGQILAGRADVMITDAIETVLQQKLHPGLCAIHPDEPFNFSEFAYLLPRDLPFKLFVDQWLRQALMTKDFAAIYDRWLK